MNDFDWLAICYICYKLIGNQPIVVIHECIIDMQLVTRQGICHVIYHKANLSNRWSAMNIVCLYHIVQSLQIIENFKGIIFILWWVFHYVGTHEGCFRICKIPKIQTPWHSLHNKHDNTRVFHRTGYVCLYANQISLDCITTSLGMAPWLNVSTLSHSMFY